MNNSVAPTRNKLWWSIVAVALVTSPACSGKNKDQEKPAGEQQKVEPKRPDRPVEPPPPAFDAAALQKMLQGKWNTGADPDKPINSFEFTGDQAEVTQHNMIDAETQKPFNAKGKLEIKGPSSFVIRTADGTGYGYNFVKLGDQLHISVADAYPIAGVDAFRIQLGMGEFLERTPAGCKWSQDFAGKQDSREVTCGIADKDGKQLFSYQVPDHFDPSKLSDRSMVVADGYLVSQQMMDEVAHRVE